MTSESTAAVALPGNTSAEVLHEELEHGIAKRFTGSVHLQEGSSKHDSVQLQALDAHTASIASAYAQKVVHERMKRTSPALGSLRQRARAARQASGLSRVEMRADHDVLQHIIGKNNSNLNRVAKEHSVKVVVDRDSRTVRVLGNSQEQVERARQALELIGDSMELSKDEVPLVIGKGGKQIHAIEKESGVHAIVVRAKRGTARIIGTPSAVAHARALIHAVVDSVAYTKHMVREAAALKRELEDLPPPQQDNKS